MKIWIRRNRIDSFSTKILHLWRKGAANVSTHHHVLRSDPYPTIPKRNITGWWSYYILCFKLSCINFSHFSCCIITFWNLALCCRHICKARYALKLKYIFVGIRLTTVTSNAAPKQVTHGYFANESNKHIIYLCASNWTRYEVEILSITSYIHKVLHVKRYDH